MQIGSPAERAALAEHAVRIRSIRRLWAIPGTRLGVVSHPARPPHRLLLGWQYWWQAHLFDCIVDAQLRDPGPERAGLAQRVVRASLIRNGFRRTNSYYDDMAWWGLALQRGNDVFGTSVSVAPIQTNMIRHLNDTNPPLAIILHNNPEPGPIVRIHGSYFEMNLGKTTVDIVGPQVNRLALRPSSKIADTASKKRKRRPINSRITHCRPPYRGSPRQSKRDGRTHQHSPEEY